MTVQVNLTEKEKAVLRAALVRHAEEIERELQDDGLDVDVEEVEICYDLLGFVRP